MNPVTPVTVSAAVSVDTLSSMFQDLEGIDKDAWGYHHAEGWNAALRRAMDYAAANPAVALQQTLLHLHHVQQLQPGDVLVISCTQTLNRDQQRELRTYLQTFLREHLLVHCPMLVLDGGMSMDVLRKEMQS